MQKNRNLLIIGAGQYGIMATEIARAMNVFEKIDFLDDSFKGALGTTRDMEKFAEAYNYGFVAIGNPEIRRRLTEQLQMNCITPAILVHPKSFVSPSAQLQKGCCIEPMATVQAGAVVAKGTFIASGAVIRHDAFVGEFCHVDCNAVIESQAIVPAETKVCCNSVFCQEQGLGLVGHNL